MLRFPRFIPPMFIGVVLGAFIALGLSVHAERSEQLGSENQLPLEGLHTFTEIFTRIKQDYVEEVSDEKLIEYAIQGMLTGLDPHSSYLDPDAFTELQVGTTGEFGGLGIEVGMQDGFVKVVSPIDDTPAQQAGVKSGDLIVRLDNTPVKGMALSDAVKLMRGKPGTSIVLSIVREGEDKPLKFTIVRDVIKVKSVRKQRILEPGYGYVRISQFQSRTGDDLEAAINQLLQESGGNLKGLVLDLRDNPGGVLNAAVDVADLFLDSGLIVYTKGRADSSELKFKAHPKDIINGTPLVVLINGGSASASEIVAGALQDHKRAVLMGARSFGKGSVQTILPMQNKAGLKLTTALYYTPNGRSIQAEGIVPDIALDKVEVASVSKAESNDGQSVTEADLRGHLNNGNGKHKTDADDAKDQDGGATDKAAPPKDGAKDSSSEDDATLMPGSNKDKTEEKPLAQSDYALYEALNLLKGLSIIKAQAH